MPARKTVPREVILSCAMELLETEGSGALNARSLAKRLGCSTQPIYLSFAGMDDLRGELLERCRMIQEGYIAREPEETLFLRATLGFLRFVYEKPNLFRFVYFENPFRNTDGDRAFIDATVTGIMQAGGYRSLGGKAFLLCHMVFHVRHCGPAGLRIHVAEMGGHPQDAQR